MKRPRLLLSALLAGILCGVRLLAAQTPSESPKISEEERARVQKQMQAFAESFKGIPELPKMNDTIILPDPEPDGDKSSST